MHEDGTGLSIRNVSNPKIKNYHYIYYLFYFNFFFREEERDVQCLKPPSSQASASAQK